jgi:hypothetical protein
MRHQYTPIFRELTTSSIWATTPATRCVWFWLLLNADPEGYVPGAIPGIAIAAHVSDDECRRAFALFLDPDPDSRNGDHEGKRLERVPGGFRILNFEYYRELAKSEAERARKRVWAKQNRKQLSLPFPPEFLPPTEAELEEEWQEPRQPFPDVAERSGNVDAPKPISKPKPMEGEEPPPPPVVEAQGQRMRYFSLDGWEPSAALIADAAMAGVPPALFEERVAELRNGPIGGTRGVFDRDAYIRRQFGRWRTWAETDRQKALAAPQARSGRAYGQAPPLEPSGAQEAYAQKHGVDLRPLLRTIADEGLVDKLGAGRAREILQERLVKAARDRKGAA